MKRAIGTWEDDGGAAGPAAHNLTGTPAQIEWAERIRLQVGAEFDRVASLFKIVAGQQTERARMDTGEIIAIVGQKRDEVLANRNAGYFIREWQELRDQIRRMVTQDYRFQAIRANREARRNT